MAASNRSLSLDGVRGLGVAAPIVVHLGLAGAGNGLWLAIGLFFILSGFLISTLALKEIDRTGRLAIKDFYARRLRRLIPAAMLVLAFIVLFASLLDWPLMSAVRRDVFAALTWTANWEQLGGTGYWEATVPSLTLHFWSLSLEEQIYVVFPVLIAIAVVLRPGMRAAVKLAWMSGGVTLVSWALLCTIDSPSRVYLSTFTRMGEAACGCCVAAVCHGLPARRTDRQASWLIVGLVALVAPLWVFAVGNETWGVRTGILVATLPTAVIVALLWRYPGSAPARLLSLRVPAWLGRRSYGIYLIHVPLIDLLMFRLHTGHLTVPWMIAAVVATIALAALLYQFVEEPIRVGKRFAGPTRFAVLIGTAALVLSVLNIQLTSDGAAGLALPDDNETPLLSGDVTFTLPPSTVAGQGGTSTFTNPPPPAAPARVLVIGDSTAWVTAGAVESLEAQGWPVDAMWMVNCPLGGDARVMATETAEAVRPRELGELPGCDQWWNEYLPEALIAFEPTLVVLVGGYVLAYEVDPAADDRWCHLGDGSGRCEEWAAARLRATTERVHTYAPQAHLVIATGGYVDPWGPQDISRPTIDVLNDLIRAEAERDGASLIDLGAWLNDHLDLLYDGIHLGTQGIDALKPWIADELAAVAAGRRLTA